MPGQGSISRRSLHGELVDRLHDMVLDGELRPGDKINEQALSARFGVSRTPLREALKVLASGGLVILSPNRGARVARISPEEVDQLFPIMGTLEALAGELACRNATNADIARIRRMHDQMVGHHERQEETPYLKLNRAIHDALFELARNDELTQLYRTLMVRTYAVRFTARKSLERWDQSVKDHVGMMAALENRDGARLAALLKEHLRNQAEMIHESLRATAAAAE